MALKLRAVKSDGTSNAGEPFDLVVKDPDTRVALPDVVIQCRVVTKKRSHEIERSFQRQVHDQKTKQLVWEYHDEDGATHATNALLAEVITGWRGIVGADDLPLVCTQATIAALDDRVKIQVITAVFGAEVVEQQSFREPAGLLHLATGARADDALLSRG